MVMILASNNKGKIKEIKSIFNDYEIFSLKDKNIDIDIEENANTFYGNALKKAKEINKITNESTIADDSGLCIDSLDGFPGVNTHRFLGDNVSEEERNNYILEKLKNSDNRNASVVCTVVYCNGDKVIDATGVLKGKISLTKRGENGFGFDEIFELEDGRTVAQLDSTEKNKMSARYLALKELKNKLQNENIND